MKKEIPKKPSDILSVGEVARRSGVAVSALHFYETKGLIPSQRNEGNQRRYPRSVLRLVGMIKVAQGLGFSLEEIKKGLSTLPQDREPTKEEWNLLSKNWKKDLNDRIQRLTSLRDHLNDCIGCGCLSMKTCPLRNPNDKLAKKGPGQHLV
jgi:redox-sensitive transcriptional activator SoxR